ncbi:TRIM3 [Branchiostoma lanceolatum]|uniref:TRIM3 protein n=1 Tax=Branchiostoma lanceolatum TaxID=7740 RepID=A0A8J9YTR6_BRALA|nr:TRIM3 [Branchiostoma lanceolatum]
MSKQGVKRYFSFIKNRVSSDWKDLAWHLDFDTPDIENIDGKHRDDKSRCMDLLQQWYKQKGNNATMKVLIKALQDAELQHVVDSLKDNYPDPVLPVHLHLGLAKQTSAQGQAGDISEERREQIRERILEVERALFTVEVLNDPVRYREVRKIFNKHKALLKRALQGSIIILLTFLRQTDVDRFYHNHYRVGEGTLSQQLSHILISDQLQDKVKGAQLIVRLHVKHEDYVRVRDRLEQGLDRTTSVDNLLALPSPKRYVDRSSLSGLDLAVVDREDQPCTDGADGITRLYRKVQSAVQTTKEKSNQAMKVQFQTMQGQKTRLKDKNKKAEKIQLEQNKKILQLQEINKNLMARIERLLTTKQPVVGVRPIRVVQPWVKKVNFGGWGSGRGKFDCPTGVAVSQQNEVYIADLDNSRIQVFTMDGVYIRDFTTTLPGESDEELQPEDVAVDRNDNLWVASNAHVVQYSREGTCLTKIDLPDVEYNRGITVAMATEQVIVTEYDGQNGRLRVFNQDGSEVDTFDSGHTHRSLEPWWPCYVTVDREGKIFVTDSNNHCVHALDRVGNFKFKFGSEGSGDSQLNDPLGISVDGMGNIIVVDSGNGCVKMFDSQGRFQCYIGSGMEGPWGVAVSPGGDMVVTDFRDHTVSVWTVHAQRK